LLCHSWAGLVLTRDFALFASLSLLTVFAHEYASVALMAIVLSVATWRFARKRFDKAEGLTVLAFLLAMAVFSAR
jgi:hypothetical protein